MKNKLNWVKAAALAGWALLFLWVFINRRSFTFENLGLIASQNMAGAVVFILLLFVLKSVTFFLYAGLLYILCGMLFSYPAALILCLIGSWIMLSVPYVIGWFMGSSIQGFLTEKIPAFQKLGKHIQQNPFLAVLLARVICRFPCDLVSLDFGSIRMDYRIYITSSMICLLPQMLIYPVMGVYIHQPGSWQFMAAIAVEIGWSVLCYSLYKIHQKHAKKKTDTGVAR